MNEGHARTSDAYILLPYEFDEEVPGYKSGLSSEHYKKGTYNYPLYPFRFSCVSLLRTDSGPSEHDASEAPSGYPQTFHHLPLQYPRSHEAPLKPSGAGPRNE